MGNFGFERIYYSNKNQLETLSNLIKLWLSTYFSFVIGEQSAPGMDGMNSWWSWILLFQHYQSTSPIIVADTPKRILYITFYLHWTCTYTYIFLSVESVDYALEGVLQTIVNAIFNKYFNTDYQKLLCKWNM